MAIMMPTQREDSLDKIAKALNIMGSVYGIKQAYDKSQQISEDRKKASEGVLSAEQGLELQKTHDVSTEEKPGAFKFVYGPTQTTYFALPKKGESKVSDAQKTAFTQENQLRGDYYTESKNALESLRGFEKVKSAYKGTKPSDDVALIFGFMKTLDPASTVREGEQAMVEQARGVPETVVNLYNKVLTGGRLTQEQRENFTATAKRAAASQLELQQQTDNKYKEIATAYGLNANNIIDKRYKSAFEKLSKELGDAENVDIAAGKINLSFTPEARAAMKYVPGTIIKDKKTGARMKIVDEKGTLQPLVP